MASDWVKVHRSLMDSAVWSDEWLVKLWMWCLLKANFKPSVFKGMMIERGQFATGQHTGADELGVSPTRWYRGMTTLEKLGNISIKANSRFSIVTVCKYDSYQGNGKQERIADELPMNSQRIADEQPTNSQRIQEKECPETETETEDASPDWTKADPTLAEFAPFAVAPLPLGKVNGSSVFDGVTAEWLRAPATVIGWFRRQLGAAEPVLPPNRAAALFALCCAARATGHGIKNPTGSFVSLITKRNWSGVKRFKDIGIQQLKEAIDNGNL